jgi:hypothetical protein
MPSSAQQASLTHTPSPSQLVRNLNHAHPGQVDDCLPHGYGLSASRFPANLIPFMAKMLRTQVNVFRAHHSHV